MPQRAQRNNDYRHAREACPREGRERESSPYQCAGISLPRKSGTSLPARIICRHTPCSAKSRGRSPAGARRSPHHRQNSNRNRLNPCGAESPRSSQAATGTGGPFPAPFAATAWHPCATAARPGSGPARRSRRSPARFPRVPAALPAGEAVFAGNVLALLRPYKVNSSQTPGFRSFRNLARSVVIPDFATLLRTELPQQPDPAGAGAGITRFFLCVLCSKCFGFLCAMVSWRKTGFI